jgi:anaerobic ribonucleoside-triphosphate reductase
VKKLEDIDEL